MMGNGIDSEREVRGREVFIGVLMKFDISL
jgi:hypothetical protein